MRQLSMEPPQYTRLELFMDILSGHHHADTSPQAPAQKTSAGRFPSREALKTKPSRHALEHALSRIQEHESQVRAWVHLADSDKLPEPDTLSGPLAGIPIGVKDVITTAGMPTRCGSSASDERPAAFHAASVEQLVRAGAIPLGKTVTAEYAFRHPGPTRNPWNVAHTPGGSSSGSAAAVAAGMVPLALSTQTGGSIIRPAAYCGVPGFKPSWGLLSRDGMQLTSESLDTIGWHASDMDWLIQAAKVLLPDTASVPAPSLAGARVAIVTHSCETTLENEGQEALTRVAALLESAGAQCLPFDASSHLDKLTRAHTAIMKYEFARNLAAVARARSEHVTASLLKNVKEGENISDSHYLEMCAFQHEMRTQWDAMSGGADFILTPSASGPAPAGHDFTGLPAFNKCWTVLGWPCLHVPAGLTSQGLPVGVQLVGPWKQDATLLSYGLLLEQLLNHPGA